MANEHYYLSDDDLKNDELLDSLDFDELEEKLNSRLETELSDLDFLNEEMEKIGSPDNLGEVIKDVVWEQFITQIGINAGENFIEENNGLTLDLSNDAHIQTTQNFENGKIATHNTKIDYQQRYDDWQSNFQKDPNIDHKTNNYRFNDEKQVWEKHDSRSGSWKKVLNKDARSDFDKGRPTGKNSANTNMDHIVSAGEIIRDAEANAHMTRKEQVDFANSDKNLNLMDSAANQSKGDSTMTEFLESERNGKKAAERFNIDEEDLRKKDAVAREEYEKKKKEAEKRSIDAGKKSQKEEALRIGKNAAKAVLMQLLVELMREIISGLVKWFKSAKRKLETLLDSMKGAIHSFIANLKKNLINAGNTLITTIVTAIVGPIFGTIKKIWILLKQGWNSLKKAIDYIRNPKNKGKPIGILLLETGKIVIAGLTGVSAILLGEVIEKALMTIPGFSVEIPLLGSLANIIGIFLGAVVSGIIGAIAINLIEKMIEKKLKAENIKNQIAKANDILVDQQKLIILNEIKLEETKEITSNKIQQRHEEAARIMKDSLESIAENIKVDDSVDDMLDEIDNMLKELGV